MIDSKELHAAWKRLHDLIPAALSPIQNETQLAHATADLEALLGEISEDAGHPLVLDHRDV